MYFLPEKFVERMKNILPESEREDFFAVYEKEQSEKGLLINTLKISVEEFERIAPLALCGAVPWAENARYVNHEKVGKEPYHFAGLYYMQEPSASCVAPKAQVKKGERVLDLCAAPGGKTAALAAATNGEGILVSNEPVPSRAQILLSNAERLGVKNAVVVNEYPEKISGFFTEYFDKIVVDAPCSGEGMFRKNAEEARREWSDDNVRACAARQSRILNEAAKMLSGGGKLVYSTCTFSREEDEEQTRNFLKAHEEFRLLSEEKLLPHKIRGEGHYCATFEKTRGGRRDLPLKKSGASYSAQRLFDEFCLSVFGETKEYSLYEKGGALYALPAGCFDWNGLKVLRCGVKIGEIIKNRFEPAHAYALSLKRGEAKNALNLGYEDPRLQKYLCGESVEGNISGWCTVCVNGYPVGWGKGVGGVVKNHLPHGLRLHG
ncbi:MAG: RsmF rRNA methyltransferase first C-terminal domain-containing protein [Candidatus Borkfalkiaceae bacterium]|nr:RsmF rRNA methyltransferase first C-terminal domain-containing protein [Clostridia bacterium]MDY6223895.1 RsmF rRNA methyltransferase first C-terminal domain-containing protein [Christensenellaceae bacterium]